MKAFDALMMGDSIDSLYAQFGGCARQEKNYPAQCVEMSPVREADSPMALHVERRGADSNERQLIPTSLLRECWGSLALTRTYGMDRRRLGLR